MDWWHRLCFAAWCATVLTLAAIGLAHIPINVAGALAPVLFLSGAYLLDAFMNHLRGS